MQGIPLYEIFSKGMKQKNRHYASVYYGFLPPVESFLMLGQYKYNILTHTLWLTAWAIVYSFLLFTLFLFIVRKKKKKKNVFLNYILKGDKNNDRNTSRNGTKNQTGAIRRYSCSKSAKQYTEQKHDMDFPHMMIYSCPTPFYMDRPIDHEAMKKAIIKGAQKLESTGVDFIAMPCNTAHLYFEELQHSLSIPILNIVDETLQIIPKNVKRVALLATEANCSSWDLPRWDYKT